MARTRMVTRTIESTKVTAMVVSVSQQAVTTEVFNIPQTYANAEKMLKALKEVVETDDLKVVSIVSSEIEQKVYGMLESKFLQLATELDEKRKIVNDDDSEVEAVEE